MIMISAIVLYFLGYWLMCQYVQQVENYHKWPVWASFSIFWPLWVALDIGSAGRKIISVRLKK